MLPIVALVLFLQSVVPAVHSSIEIDKTAEVRWVIDGDTFDTTAGDRIRLADIDAPESGESGYSSAKTFLASLVDNKRVYLDIDDVYRTDKYGRLICVVHVNYNSTHYKNVNKALLVGGYATIWNFNNEFDPYTWTLYTPKETKQGTSSPPDTQSPDTAQPKIVIFSPEEFKTYTEENIQLTFSVDGSTSWVGYSLNRGQVVTITGNTTLSGLTDRWHSLTVYAKDTAGNTWSETIYFSIGTQYKDPERTEPLLLPTTELSIVILVVIAGIIGFVIGRMSLNRLVIQSS